MSAQTIPFPRAKKRGAKVKRGPCAHIHEFPVELVSPSPVRRYALAMAAKYEPEDYDKALDDHLEIGQRLLEAGLIDATGVERIIINHRNRVLRELQRLDCI